MSTHDQSPDDADADEFAFGEPTLYADCLQVIGSSTAVIPGKLPVYQDGFGWTVLVDRDVVVVERDDEAGAVKEDAVVARGRIEEIEVTPDGVYSLHVTVP